MTQNFLISSVRHRVRPVPPSPSPASPALDQEVGDAGVPSADPQELAYRVGYAKPPVEHRFKPGKSGNPKGRPKGARGINATVRDTLEAKIVIRTGGKARSVSRLDAVLLKLVEQGLQGNIRAAEKLLGLYRAAAPEESREAEAPGTTDLSETDAEILLRFRDSILSEQKGGPS